MFKTLFLVTGNHANLKGLEDIFTMAKNILTKEYRISYSEKIQENQLNIVVEDFTNEGFNIHLKDVMSRSPKTKIIIITTEFIERKFGYSSFNFYHIFPNILLNLLVDIFNGKLELDLSTTVCKNKSNKILASLLLPCYLSICIISLFIGKKNKQFFMNYVKNICYIHLRFVKLKYYSRYISAFITLHPKMNDQYTEYFPNIPILGSIFPLFSGTTCIKKCLSRKKIGISFTGTLSRYRLKSIQDFERFILLNGLKSIFGQSVKIKKLNDLDKKLDNLFSFHPRKENYWKFSSPTRIWRSIEIDETMPLSDTNKDQHPISIFHINFKNKVRMRSFLLQFYQDKDILFDEHQNILVRLN